MMHQGWCEDSRGVVYFGEYQVGKKHTVTRLYWSQDRGRTWSIRHEFPRSEIRHIHAVQFDPHRNLLWIATGDSNHESRILYSSDQGATFHELVSGNQDARTVSLQFTPTAIYWGTDSPHRAENNIFRWNWETHHKKRLVTVRNAFYYSAQCGEGNLFFSTSVERPKDYGTSMFSEVWQIQYDNFPRLLLKLSGKEIKMRGTIELAQGLPPTGWLAFTPINLAEHHCEAVVAKLLDFKEGSL